METLTDFVPSKEWIALTRIVGLYLFCLLAEKGVSIFQHRKFRHRYAYGAYLLVISLPCLLKEMLGWTT